MTKKSKKKSRATSMSAGKAGKATSQAAATKLVDENKTRTVPAARTRTKARSVGQADLGGTKTRRKSGGATSPQPSGSRSRDSQSAPGRNGHVKSRSKPKKPAVTGGPAHPAEVKRKTDQPGPSVDSERLAPTLATSEQGIENSRQTGGTRVRRTVAEDQMIQRLFSSLDACAESQQIGRVAQDALFDWGENAGEVDLRPDLAFVSFERWAPYRHVPMPHVWHVVPDLVVMIKRESELKETAHAQLEGFFKAGVLRVWVIVSARGEVYDHESLEQAAELGRDHVIQGGEVVPGFELPVRELL